MDNERNEINPSVEGKRQAIHPERARAYLSRLFFAILILTAVNVAVQITASYVFAYKFPDLYNTWQFLWIASVVPLYCISLPIFMKALPRREKELLPEKQTVKTRTVLLYLLIALATMGVFNYISFFSVELLRILSNDTLFATDSLNEIVSSSPIWVTVLVACIIAPIGEEFIFRKLIVDRTLPFGELAACMISGIVFGLFHGNLRQAIYATALGFVLAYVYSKTRNLIYPILMHMLVNICGSVIVPNLASYAEDGINAIAEGPATPELISENILSLLIYLGIFGVGGTIIVGGIVALIILICKKKITFKKCALLPQGTRIGRLAVCNTGAVVALIFFVILIIRSAIL